MHAIDTAMPQPRVGIFSKPQDGTSAIGNKQSLVTSKNKNYQQPRTLLIPSITTNYHKHKVLESYFHCKLPRDQVSGNSVVDLAADPCLDDLKSK